MPEMPTSAFGALATTVPSASRTTMSVMRSEVRPCSSRSICVPPTETVRVPPKLSSIAALSHGVTSGISIGPLESRHHNSTVAVTIRAKPSVVPQKICRTSGRRAKRTSSRCRCPHCRRPGPSNAIAARCFSARGVR